MPADDSMVDVRGVQPAGEIRPWPRAMAWLAFLGPFFFLTYGFANWWTGRLARVDSVWFAWEKYIPFVDWTILPYMSVDAFYAGSLFLCSSRDELDTHAKRLLSATLISVTGFLLFPLQFSFVRPPSSGFNRALFDVLAGFDKPFNQAPSLHISLLILLWLVYARHLRGVLLWLMHVWFFLIGISIFTTYQHHVIDGLSGAIVGVVCVYLFPDHPRQWSRDQVSDSRGRLRLARNYLLAGFFFLALAYLLQAWAWLLLWPGIALILVSLAYLQFGVGIFQKHEGRLSWPARALLAPYQISAWISSRWFTRHGAPSAEVVNGIWIGRAPGRSDWQHLDPRGLLDLTAEFDASSTSLARRHVSVPMLDLIAPSREQLERAVHALNALCPHAPVLVHCALGYSRSALVIAAWLLRRGLAATPRQALELVRAARPQIVFPPSYEALLNEFHQVGGDAAVGN